MASNGEKYGLIILAVFKTHSGHGHMQIEHILKMYGHLDEPNQLVDRLRLLAVSQRTGLMN